MTSSSVHGVQRGTPSSPLFALVVLLASRSLLSSAQVICGTTSAMPLQIQSVAEATALAAAVNCTDGGTVEAVWSGAITLSASISIGSGTYLSITGEDAQAEVRGGSSTRLFDVSSAGGLTLTQLKLSGGSATSGGAIYATTATVTLDSCVFDGNAATAGDGGAVWVEGGNLTVIAGEFSSNTAHRNGGAVYTLNAGLVIQGGNTTAFEDNAARLQGGGLFCGGTKGEPASCSLNEGVFTSNQAALMEVFEFDGIETWQDLFGGGGAAFSYADVFITDSVFELNFGQISGGGIFGGNDTTMTIDGSTFQNNTTNGYGAGVVASSATLGGKTRVANNIAAESGGGVFGWDDAGVVVLGDIDCSQNSADENGGGFYSVGTGVVNSDTTMLENVADAGGCIYAAAESNVTVDGGEFTGCRSQGNGAFLYASDDSLVTIKGGTVTNCVAGRRAGMVYCSGDSKENGGGSMVTIEGGTFSDNQALELGGAIVAWGTNDGTEDPTVVTITGGIFRNNTATFYGGFIFLEELASLSCTGATIEDHFAGDQGGAIYGREATWVNSSCDLISNRAPQGAAAYLTHTAGGVNFENHLAADNEASGGSVVHATETSMMAKAVSFQAGGDLQEDTSNRAIQLEGGATLVAEDCVFGGWMGDTVIYNLNPANGSLVLDSCDFSESTAVMVVTSPYSDAIVRNAVIDQTTIENAAVSNNTLVLVDRAVDCSESSICGPGECVDSDLGVLCECLEDSDCLDGGGALSITVKTPPAAVTFSPELVYFELMVSAAADGTAPAIWELTHESEELALQVFPSSGVLPPGDNVTVSVTGSALEEDVGGGLVSRFVATSIGSGNSDSAAGVDIEVESEFYLCQSSEYALPADDGGVTCLQCFTISGAEGLDCEDPGATLASLPVREGYWRSSRESLAIKSCLHPEACVGATQVSSSDDYCDEGYEGPYCAVCADGSGQGSSYTCHSCTGPKSRLLIFAGSLFALLVVTFLFIAVVFLVGGLDAVDDVRESLSRSLSISGKVHRPPRARAIPIRKNLLGVKSRSRSSMTASANARAAITPAPFASLEVEGGNEETRVAIGSSAPVGPISSKRMSAADRADLRDPSEDETSSAASEKPGCCGIGERIKRGFSLLPMDKLKILVVVWQILTVFPSITGADFPPAYSRFLSWIDIVNLDLGNIFSSTCVLPAVNFYQRLLLTTLLPLGLAAVLVVTYRMAIRRAGIGMSGVMARRAAWSRHMAAGLLLTFLVFTSTSTMTFKTFPCDKDAVEGESYLRADYSLSCDTTEHTYYKIYAGFCILLYPIGIPVLYAFILWTNRDSLNPRVQDVADSESGEETARAKDDSIPNTPDSLQQKLEKRRKNPDLVPSMFLWKDFGPDMYYYEVIECGRRILLTGVLIFFPSGTAPQAAMACMFAFASLLGFELLRPHLDNADVWLYRLGCVVIFLSNFLALLIKVDAAGEGNRDGLGGIMIALNVFLILAVVSTSWFSTQQSVDDSRDDENSLALAKTMLTFEQAAADNTRLSREEKSPRS